jgi:Tfp pilus assembly protein PilN
MINLLPDTYKKEIVAGRSNIKLVNYIVILAIGAVFLGFISAAVYFVIIGTKANAEALIVANKSKSSSYSTVQAQADSLRTSLATAKSTLEKEVVYTKVLTGIAGVMPAGSVLQTLSLSPATLGAPITLLAYTKTIDDALALKDAFQQSALFSNVSFTDLSTASSSPDYPITVNISVTINKAIAK